MSDSEDSKASPAVPQWQLDSKQDQGEQNKQDEQEAAEQPQTPEDKLEVARRFLDEDEVKTASREKKVEFLQSKGIPEADIQELLGGASEAAPTEEASQRIFTATTCDNRNRSNNNNTSLFRAHPSSSERSQTSRRHIPRVPHQARTTTPLVTTNGLINTICAFAGLSTILYGASKYVVAPMVESLTDARFELHETTSKRLDDIVTKLESTVSVIPTYKSSEDAADDASDAEDPSEMFHRDIGTQTSFPSSPSIPKSDNEPVAKQHADRLAKFTKSLSSLKDDYRSQSTGLQDVKTVLDVFRDELDSMTYGNGNDYVGGFDMYGKLKRSEPEDEIRKARDNIRRIKGVLLSTRNFPTSVR
ncbi:hypothetical protein PT974_10165 [Cladobotryum mycophilum]|uniref:Peroxisomal membrane protein PEX14 n=1 Tax=Cladobotryum mycophilum TaxID=491253 RepID=A0ABR0S934_9HYPO